MPFYAMNHDAIARRGGVIANSSFVFWKCTVCGAYALFDEEIMALYRNPADLSDNVFADFAPCAACGAPDPFSPAPDDDLMTIRTSAWAFALTDG